MSEVVNEALYVCPCSVCLFCGSQGIPVVASAAVDDETPPGICEDCALDAERLLDLFRHGICVRMQS